MKKNWLFILFVMMMLGKYSHVWAQQAYIYIEGIKGYPISASINGQTLKPTAKNYILLQTSKEGENNVEIKFAGDAYPAQLFTVDVILNHAYGFKLAKANEEKFYLLDIVNQGKIVELNNNVSFALSTNDNYIHTYDSLQTAITHNKKSKSNKLKISKIVKDKPKEISENSTKEVRNNQQNATQYGIIEEIQAKPDSGIVAAKTSNKRNKKKSSNKNNSGQEMANTTNEIPVEQPELEKNTQDTVVVIPKINKKKSKEKIAKNTAVKPTEEIKNTVVVEEKTPVELVIAPSASPKPKCLRGASDSEILAFNDKLKQKTDDEAKLILLKKKYFTGCLSTKQVYSIVELFDTQYGRFTVVKFIKPEMLDAENLYTLEPLFKYETYKVKLKKLAEE